MVGLRVSGEFAGEGWSASTIFIGALESVSRSLEEIGGGMMVWEEFVVEVMVLAFCGVEGSESESSSQATCSSAEREAPVWSCG